jgi:hypothetical protein
MKKASVSSILIAVVLLTVGVIAEAQQTGKVFRIGYLDGGTASGMATILMDAFRHELSKLGWIEGKNITIEYRLRSISLPASPSWRRNWFVKRLI